MSFDATYIDELSGKVVAVTTKRISPFAIQNEFPRVAFILFRRGFDAKLSSPADKPSESLLSTFSAERSDMTLVFELSKSKSSMAGPAIIKK